MRAKKFLGQNFLRSSDIANSIVLAAGPLDSSHVIEIGPGKGILTKAILRQNPLSLTAIEKDVDFTDLHRKLEDEFKGVYKFISGDALIIDERNIVSGPVKLIGNIPYNISTALLLKWLDYLAYFSTITLTVQREVALRLAAVPKTKQYGKLSVLFNTYSDSEIKFDIEPHFFSPVPKVVSSVINIIPLKNPIFEIDIPLLKIGTNLIFSNKRKILKNSIAHLFDDPLHFLNSIGIDGKLRAEELPPQEICNVIYQMRCLNKI